jgi:hypothetical protein
MSERSVIKFSREAYGRFVKKAEDILESTRIHFFEAVDICKDNEKTPPTFEEWKKEPRNATLRAVTKGVKVTGAKIAAERLLDLMDINLSFLQKMDVIKAKEPKLYDVIGMSKEGVIGYPEGFLEAAKEEFIVTTQNQKQEELFQMILDFQNAIFKIKDTLPNFMLDRSSYDKIMYGLTQWSTFEETPSINIDRLNYFASIEWKAPTKSENKT